MKRTLQIKLKHKTLALIAVPIFFQAVYIGILGVLLNSAEKEAWRERHSRLLISECNALLNNVVTASVSMYSYSFTREEMLKARFLQLSELIPQEIEFLKNLLKEDPKQSSTLAEMQTLSKRTHTILALGKDFIDGEIGSRKLGRDQLSSEIKEFLQLVNSFVAKLQKSEKFDPQAEAKARQSAFSWLLFGFVFNVLIALALALAYNRNITRRLEVLVANTNLLKSSKPLLERLKGEDEISVLDDTFHNLAEALAETSRRKQEIVSMVTHDLRTPLTSINSLFTLFEQGALGEISQKSMDKVKKAALSSKRLIGLINDLLDVEKLEAGQMSMNRRPVELGRVLQASVDAVIELAAAKNVVIAFNSDTDETLLLDEERIIQVLVNLLSNAVKFSPESETVRIEYEDKGDSFEIRVVDRGRGVAPEYHEAIFERFKQVEASDGVKGKGTGLGLPICKLIIEAHGGRIGCRNGQDAGTIFWFQIPS